MSDDVFELLHRAPAPPMSVDPDAAMTAGRNARRRTRLLVGAVAAAVLAVVAIGIRWSDREPPLPATPANAQRFTMHPGATGEVPEYTLWAAPPSPASEVLVTAKDRGGREIAAVRVRLTKDGLGFGRVTPRDRTILLIVGPGDTLPTTRPAPTPQRDLRSWWGQAEFDGTGLAATALPLLAGEDGSDVRAVYTTLPGRGGVFSDGSAVATARVGGAILWINRTHRIVGHQSAAGESAGDIGSGRDPSGGYLAQEGSAGNEDGTTTLEAAGELPAGATRVTVAADGGVPSGVTAVSAPYSDGKSVAVYLVRTTKPLAGTEPSWAPVTGITWIDARGNEHTTPLG